MVKRCEVLLLTVLVLSTAAARDRPTDGDSLSFWLKTIPAEFVNGIGTATVSPRLRLHWAATGLGILAALPFDDDVQAVRSELVSDQLARLGDAWGGAWAAVTILPGIYLAESLRGTSRGETLRRLEFAGLSLSAVVATTYLLKWATGRERPNSENRRSFPSGHTSAAFGVAEVVRILYGNWVGAVLYALAVNTGLSRIHDNKHYLSDVVAGAGLGIGLVRGFDLARRPAGEADTLRITISISLQKVIIGINF